jgi:hypothetical protein
MRQLRILEEKMPNNFTTDALRHVSDLGDLNLSDEELQQLLPGVTRSKKQAAELRDLIKANDEPAGVFIAACQARK